jgi:predicted nucleic acid-binding protein
LPIFFVDTSVLAKRYVNETGTRWVRSWITPRARNSILISELTTVEIFSVLARREHMQDISLSSANRRRQAFLYHISEEYLVIPVNSQVFIESRDLVTKHVALALRSLDAIQLACALKVHRALGELVMFVGADGRLLKAAAAEGFTTIDLNQHL